MGAFDIVIAFLSLTLLEIVLGIDNLVFLAIVTQRLPKSLQSRARKLGLTLAWASRLILLACALWLIKSTRPIIFIFNLEFSLHDIFLILGGMFLLMKSTQEIHAEMEPGSQTENVIPKFATFSVVVFQIGTLDIIFSLDSVLTA